MKRKLIALTTIFALLVPITLPQTAYADTKIVVTEKTKCERQLSVVESELKLVDSIDDIATEWFNRDYINIKTLDTIIMTDADIRDWSNNIKNEIIKTKKSIAPDKFDMYTKAITKYNDNIKQLMDIFRELD